MLQAARVHRNCTEKLEVFRINTIVLIKPNAILRMLQNLIEKNHQLQWSCQLHSIKINGKVNF
jgi:hypothetical protein